jgi:hypothetical protein
MSRTVPLKSTARSVALACLLSLPCVALAQTLPAAVDAKMKKIVAEQADEGAKLIGEIKTGSLEEDATATFTFPIQRSKTYWVYAACGACDDIDLEGKNQRGDVLDADDEKDDVDPVLLVSDRYATQLNVTIEMKACGDTTCPFGLGLYESPLVWPGGPPQ